MPSISAQKKQIRKNMSSMRKGMFSKTMSEKSLHVTHQLLSWDVFKNSKSLGLYLSKDDEAQTALILSTAKAEAKACYAPKMMGDQLFFGRIGWDNPLIKGQFDVEEPMFVDDKAVFEILLLPCVGFNYRGNRLGRGKGYFDRFLSSFKGLKVCLAFDVQHISHIPTDTHDQSVDYVVTESQVFRCQ